VPLSPAHYFVATATIGFVLLGCAGYSRMDTSPRDYVGGFPEQIRLIKVDGSRPLLREAYIKDGVLYGIGRDEDTLREQRYAFAVTEIEAIEVWRSDPEPLMFVAAAATWCLVNVAIDQHCAWPFVKN
jgi:hypothetical protein